MSSEHLTSMPIDRRRDSKHAQTPQLSDVLAGRSEGPWSLAAFSDYLQKNFCDEVLLFVNDVNLYRQTFESKIVEGASHEDVLATYTLWREILATYIMPNGHREINIPGAVRCKLLSQDDPLNPPSPRVLHQARDMMMELMTTTFYQFVENVRVSQASAISEKASYKRSCSDDEGSVSSSDSNEPLPFYRRAHALWGPSRVYRNVRYYNGNASKTSAPKTSIPNDERLDPVENQSKPKQPLRRPVLKWSSSSPSSSS